MIETVRGPVAPGDLGVTCMHDHILSDSSRLRRDGAQPAPDLERVSLENLGYLRWNMLASIDNLRLDDEEAIVADLADGVSRGQRTLVECSSLGLGPNHAALAAVSVSSGMQIVSAYGAYIPRTVPGWVSELSESALEEHFLEALTVAVPGTAFRAGMLGIMGTTDELAERERVQLRAAGRAAARTGAAVSVRLDGDAFHGPAVIALLEGVGLPADRIVFTNADEYMDAAYWSDLSAAGAVLEMCFGTEACHVGRVDNPSDRERLAFFPEFVLAHPLSRHVLGQSLWTKAQLAAYGGHGYGYLMGRIVPQLRSLGVSSQRLDAMLVTEPRRVLDRDAAAE